MLSVLAPSDVSFANTFPIDCFKCMFMCITKGYTETFFDLRMSLTKSTHLNQSMRLPLRCALRYVNSEADIANARWHPGFPVHPQ